MIDNFAWLGNQEIPLNPQRWGAIALLLGAIVLIYLGNLKQGTKEGT